LVLGFVLDGLDNFVEGGCCDFFEFAFEMLVDFSVQFPQAFAQFGVEVVLDAVVSSVWV